jgi:arylsulfatase A-like enzyme
MMSDDRPNIIFLLTDDQRDGSFGAMGHPFAKTPNVDRLLADSVRFTNTYVAEPICSPSRVSYLTGMHERVHGIGFTSSYQLTEEQWARSYPALLRDAGYYTGFIGKFGVEYYTFRGDASEKFDYWWGHDGWTKFLPKEHEGPSCTPYHRAEADEITFIMGEAMNEFLDSVPEDEPFCLSVSFNIPHGSQTTSMYTGYSKWNQMLLPANENPALEGSPFYDVLYRDIEIAIPEETGENPYRYIPKAIMDQDKGRRTSTYPYAYSRPTCTELHVRYYQTISGLDHVIGELLADLERRGLAENTVIIYGSDHGLLMGEHAMGGKSLLYDLASKIPCFVHDPRVPPEQRGREVDELVSSIDVTRTILDYAGVEAPGFMDGASLRPLVEQTEAPWRDSLFLESLYTGRDTPFQEGIRRGKWKYIRMFDAPGRYNEAHVTFTDRRPDFEMLFDLEADPGETTNLISEHDESFHVLGTSSGAPTGNRIWRSPPTETLASLRAQCEAESKALNARREEFQTRVNVKWR